VIVCALTGMVVALAAVHWPVAGVLSVLGAIALIAWIASP
jgi:hypothetical protein